MQNHDIFIKDLTAYLKTAAFVGSPAGENGHEKP